MSLNYLSFIYIYSTHRKKCTHRKMDIYDYNKIFVPMTTINNLYVILYSKIHLERRVSQETHLFCETTLKWPWILPWDMSLRKDKSVLWYQLKMSKIGLEIRLSGKTHLFCEINLEWQGNMSWDTSLLRDLPVMWDPLSSIILYNPVLRDQLRFYFKTGFT